MAGIIAVAKDQPGIFAKISVALVRAKIHVANRSAKKTGEGLVQYVLTVNCLDSKTLAAIDVLKTIEGVVEVSPTETVVNEKIQTADLKVVDQLKRAYPDIVGIVRDYSASLNPEETASRVFGVGHALGLSVAKAESNKPPASATALCDDIIINSISAFCFAERSDNRLVVTLCPFCRDTPEHIHNCNFLHGLISGSFSAFSEWSGIKVTEVSSQAGGADQCVFNINAVNQ